MFLALLATLNTSPPCALPFPIAADQAAALAIAKVVIAGAPKMPPKKDIVGYELVARYLPDSLSWEITQKPISALKGLRFLDGEGLSMEIAACDGTVSDIRLNRASLAKVPEAKAR
ncbi:hypothetical protein [Sphingomonas sanguinis]|uniref:Uncharacterized protein n=1 Tax=Sphingomonas sanguinis TaxID=33051 RepID=A0A7Y7QT29_9SPHN|nr:hypothetical protein [Sphingomonas sanguinis]MBZ6380844.1 hypothetical protein [Sphingomonas sanguinis]NNG49344.1 hypothetical protein [Sphingomonas sanguinis]NNG53478.1 hypothetical protein [Sphingomonas sanguinis]NVP30147.1 hypothetical protein [Sphingomonas sanguinis]HJO67098.1 hypothetical protein [Sphingomonas sanguinis]